LAGFVATEVLGPHSRRELALGFVDRQLGEVGVVAADNGYEGFVPGIGEWNGGTRAEEVPG
jgi:hypothetical protein